MRKYNPTKKQTKLLAETFQSLVDMFIRDAAEYKTAFVKACEGLPMKTPMDDQFFRDSAFTGFLTMGKRNIEETESAQQNFHNMKEIKKILGYDK